MQGFELRCFFLAYGRPSWPTLICRSASNSGATEIIEMPNCGHALTIEQRLEKRGGEVTPDYLDFRRSIYSEH